jgi:hypothetical protein
MGKERFKITIKDRITGEKSTFYAHSAGFQFNARYTFGKIEVVRIVLDHPTTKNKEKKK